MNNLTIEQKFNIFLEGIKNSSYNEKQALDVFLNTSGLDFSHPVGAIMTAMLARKNTIRIYASNVSPVIWYADSLHKFKAPIYSLNGTVTDADVKSCYVLNEFISNQDIGDRADLPCIWQSEFKTIEEYKAHYKIK